MGDKTSISWTDSSWNPVRGCTRVSEGCRNCYAETIAARFSDRGAPYHGFAERGRVGSKWTGRVEIVENALDQPMRWRRPRRIFVNSMSDLFHEKLSDKDIDRVFAVMAVANHHIYQVLTKRADRMRHYFEVLLRSGRWLLWRHPTMGHDIFDPMCAEFDVMFRHVNLGVSVENQAAADERIPHLLDTPAAVRFLSCEPLLESLDLTAYLSDLPSVHMVIVGGESGPGARPMHPHWAMALRDQCAAAGVAFWMKQVGSRHEWWPSGITEKGDNPMQWPEELRVQEFPECVDG